jgi:3-methyladenine DNA glycosylase AlkD
LRSHYQRALAELRKHRNAEKAAFFPGYFKDSAGDTFLGVTVPWIRRVARQFAQMPLSDVQRLMKSRVHEERLLANEVLRIKFQRGDTAQQEQVYRFYKKNLGLVRGWDSVDGTAPYILGAYLLDRDKSELYRLAVSPRIWDRRIAIVSTRWFITRGNTRDTLKIAKLLLQDDEDVIHKATGWMLREVGKQELAALKKFLQSHAPKMPRTMLRYAIERFPDQERRYYLRLGG